MTLLKAPELLLPAGSLDKMRAAYDFGADAVYAGQPRYSLRARNNEFRLEQIGIGIAEAHARGKKFFVTSNRSSNMKYFRSKIFAKIIEKFISNMKSIPINPKPLWIFRLNKFWKCELFKS